MGRLIGVFNSASMRLAIKGLVLVALMCVTAKRAATTAMRGASHGVLSPLDIETVAALAKSNAKRTAALKNGE